jgi:hypothetical protein
MRFRGKAIFIIPFVALNIFSGVAVAGIDAGKVILLRISLFFIIILEINFVGV